MHFAFNFLVSSQAFVSLTPLQNLIYSCQVTKPKKKAAKVAGRTSGPDNVTKPKKKAAKVAGRTSGPDNIPKKRRDALDMLPSIEEVHKKINNKKKKLENIKKKMIGNPISVKITEFTKNRRLLNQPTFSTKLKEALQLPVHQNKLESEITVLYKEFLVLSEKCAPGLDGKLI